MNRVASVSLQHSMADAIQRSQQKLAASELQLATGKKSPDLAGLGATLVPDLSAHSLAAQQKAYVTVTKGLATTLALYDANISNVDTVGSSLLATLTDAVGSKGGAGLGDAISSAFANFRTSLNASDGGTALFAGSQTDVQPFKPQTLTDTIGAIPATAFANDNVHASARVANNLDLKFGVTASELGTGMLAAFRTLAEAGTFGAVPTAAQAAALTTAIAQLSSALDGVRGLNAENGNRQAQVDTLATRAQDRLTLLAGVITDTEDADLGQVAIDLAQQKMVLQASYSVFSQLSGLSLISYLR